MNICMQNVIKNIKKIPQTTFMRSCMISLHTHIQRTPVRRPKRKDFKRLTSGDCVRVGVRCGDGIKCGFRVQVGPRPMVRVRVRDGVRVSW